MVLDAITLEGFVFSGERSFKAALFCFSILIRN
jgi:hypothetical protein